MSLYTTAYVAIILLLTLLLTMLDTSSSSLVKEQHSRKRRAWIIDSFSIEEEHPGPFPYILGTIEVERDYRVGFALHGKGVDEDPVGILSIDEKTGMVKVHGKVDYEQNNVLRLVFLAKNISNMKLDTKLGVEISILDINDHAPKFQKEIYEVTTEESVTQGTNLIMVLATDADAPGTPNSTFDYRIASVTPNTPNVEFFIKQNGQVSFKGCLDYEKAQKYTILVEAKDRGEVVRLSSTCTVIVNVSDRNNHIPTFLGRTGEGKVMERESGVVLRLHVDDKDLRNTPAWRAKFTIHGDKDNHFKIETDPETNDGILIVEKPLDFEEGPERNLSISLENEEPYFFCEVKRKTSTGLWQVVTTAGTPGVGIPKPLSERVTIIVEDINDPPIFKHAIKNVMVEENLEIGHPLEKFTAVDLDRSYTNTFEYTKGDDPDNWVTVDSRTGQISTAKVLDRESPFVVNNTYTLTLYAIDKGKPPMTATATLTIHLKDVNDNVPYLNINTLDMCLSEGPTTAKINATDLDQAPYSGPFRFELLGDIKDKWHLDPHYGNTVNLVKESKVYAGHHELQLKIYDTQGKFSHQNLSVTVCDCSETTNCRTRRSPSTQVGRNAVGIVLASLLLLMGILFLALLISCAREKTVIQIDQSCGEYLIPSNIESRGTDCKVPFVFDQIDKGQGQEETPQIMTANVALQQCKMSNKSLKRSSFKDQSTLSLSARPLYKLQNGNSFSSCKNISMQSNSRNSYKGSTLRRVHSTSRGSVFMRNKVLSSLLSQRVYSIQAPSKELTDYEPHLYAYEEDLVTDPDLDAISIPESSFNPENLLYLGPRFNKLAAICRPTPILH